MSNRSRRYPPELKERAVRMVFEHQGEYPSQWKAIQSIGEQLRVHHESLRVWVRRAEIDAGQRPGLTTDERARMKQLERENRELKRANESGRNQPVGATEPVNCMPSDHRRFINARRTRSSLN